MHEMKLITLCSWFMLTFSVVAQSSTKLELPLGLWEGISDAGMEYKLFEISKEGRHRFFSLKIATGFKKGKVQHFTDNDIFCTNTECIVTIPNNQNTGQFTRFVLSPYFETGFNVIETIAEENKTPLLTYTYRLDKQDSQSTPRQFLQDYQHRMTKQQSASSVGIAGIWLGVLRIEGKPELLALEVNETGKSHFIRYINGQSYVNSTSFDMTKYDAEQQPVFIETEHPTFANQLIIQKLSNSMLSGYMYSVRKNQPLQDGTFSLHKLR